MSIAEKILRAKEDYDAVYAAGQAQGGGGSYDEGVEAGKQAEYDRFWDEFQENGKREDYRYAFAYRGWTVGGNFKPKYKTIKPTNITSMFRENAGLGIENLADYIVFDFSNCVGFSQAFMSASIGNVGVLDLSMHPSTSFAYFLYFGQFHTVEKLILPENGKNAINNMFDQCTKLVNITIEGGTFNSSVGFPHSRLLSTESVQSIIDHLKDLTGATAQQIVWHSSVLAKLTEEQIATILAKNWTM